MIKVGAVLDFVFGCRHRQLSRVFTIDRHTYRVCCDCGKKFDYALEQMSMVKVLGGGRSNRKAAPAARVL